MPSPPSRGPRDDESGTRVHGQQLARLEDQLLRPVRELEQVAHAAGAADELDDVAAPHRAGSDFDARHRCAADDRGPHRVTPTGAGRSTARWHRQSHAS